MNLKKENWRAKCFFSLPWVKSLIILLVTIGSISIVSFATVIEAPVGIVNARFNLSFSSFTGIVKNC